jgi:RNA polymerase sigma factor (sigma-70 family)
VPDETSKDLQELLEALRDPANRALVLHQIFDRAYKRLKLLASKMLQQFSRFKQSPELDGTTELTHQVVVRLYESLQEISPNDVRHLFNLAAQNIHWILLDLARESQKQPLTLKHPERQEAPIDPETSPPALWGRLYEEIDRLEPELAEAVRLVYFQGLTHDEAAAVIGVSGRAVRYRLTNAKIQLFDAMGKNAPLLNGIFLEGIVQ